MPNIIIPPQKLTNTQLLYGVYATTCIVPYITVTSEVT